MLTSYEAVIKNGRIVMESWITLTLVGVELGTTTRVLLTQPIA